MNDELANRIKQTFPTGFFEGIDKSALLSTDRDDRLRLVLAVAEKMCSLNFHVMPFDTPAYRIALTQNAHPPFEVWTEQMSNHDKLAWIEANGQPYPVFWLNVSRVAEFYYCFYNHWVPRGDTGHLDADFKRQPNPLWSGYEKTLRQALAGNGFEHLNDELSRENTPFVLKQDFDAIPGNDPRWDDGKYEPPIVPVSVHECLFGH